VELQVDDKLMDLRQVPVPRYAGGYRGLNTLLNFRLDVRTTSNARNFLFVDSVLASVDW
jgi:hypothetical protein